MFRNMIFKFGCVFVLCLISIVSFTVGQVYAIDWHWRDLAITAPAANANFTYVMTDFDVNGNPINNTGLITVSGTTTVCWSWSPCSIPVEIRHGSVLLARQNINVQPNQVGNFSFSIHPAILIAPPTTPQSVTITVSDRQYIHFEGGTSEWRERSQTRTVIINPSADMAPPTPPPTPPPTQGGVGACSTNWFTPFSRPRNPGFRGSCGCRVSNTGRCHGCGSRCGTLQRVVGGCSSSGTCRICTGTSPNRTCTTHTRLTVSSWTYCPDYNRDNQGTDRYNGCEIPGDNSTCFWTSPQRISTHSQQSCGNMNMQGGCGSTSGCGNACDRQQWLFNEPTCRRARDGLFQCGGRSACSGGVTCGRNYLNTTLWGTNPGHHTNDNPPRLNTREAADAVIAAARSHSPGASHQLTSDRYTFCDLRNNRSVANQVCNLTGRTSFAGHEIFCRCGQSDFCALERMEDTDLIQQPADLRIVDLRLENSIGPAIAGPPGSGPAVSRSPLINTYGQHRLVVQFEVVPLSAYIQAGNAGMTQDMINRSILYTRLIEVCPVNIAAATSDNWATSTANWAVQAGNQCVIKRVDGYLTPENLRISVPVNDQQAAAIINKSDISQGPWTIRFRTINDVCNRTYGDYVVTTGRARNCTSGQCIRINTENTCVTGRFGGIRARGNAPSAAYGAGSVTQLSYCALRNDAVTDTQINRGRPVAPPAGAIDPVRNVTGGGYPGVDHTVGNQNIDEWVN